MPVVREIDIQDYIKELGKDGKFFKKYRKEIFDAVYDGALKSIEEFAEVTPVDTGLMSSSWEVQKSENENLIEFGNTAPHSPFVEYGTEPFTPPIAPLIEWAARKLQLQPDHPEVKQLAFRVRYKIKKYGMKPHHILENGIDDILLPNIKESLDKAFEDL